MNEKSYYISVNGALVEVTEEQHLCYYRGERRMRYFERDIKTETPIRDEEGNITGFKPSKEDSLERLLEAGVDFADEQQHVEDDAIRGHMADKLRDVLDKLSPKEHELIDALFFSNGGRGMSEREYAALSGMPRKTIAYRRQMILAKLKDLIEN